MKVNKKRDLIILILTTLIVLIGAIYAIYTIFFAPPGLTPYEYNYPLIKAALQEAVEELKLMGKIPRYDWGLLSKVIEVFINHHAHDLTTRFVQDHINWKGLIPTIVTYPEILHFCIRKSIAALATAGITDFQTASAIFDGLRIQIIQNFDQLDQVCKCIAEGLDQWTKDFNARPKFDSHKYPELRFMNDKWAIQHGKIEFLKTYVNLNLHKFVIR